MQKSVESGSIVYILGDLEESAISVESGSYVYILGDLEDKEYGCSQG